MEDELLECSSIKEAADYLKNKEVWPSLTLEKYRKDLRTLIIHMLQARYRSSLVTLCYSVGKETLRS